MKESREESAGDVGDNSELMSNTYKNILHIYLQDDGCCSIQGNTILEMFICA